ncbi:hypothetical protein [Marinobacter sp. F4206]|uniref:hypothetical protein n=1 Tax=Marinobacter sp. F4206 TaxID=2861777 RepID=UPI001C5FAE53|nr:hypothetical protein [Marinobacter sp. F4206]MBW4933229.1 hypothetical protein [Marinobacter sp. F4206]
MEEKVARICWNSKNWSRPSGRQGKSKNRETWEYKNGYGHEEWLFDLDKIIDGYHYAFLQAANTDRRVLVPGEALKIYLYTIDSEKNIRWWIGCINNVELVGPEDSALIHAEYESKGWLAEMAGQIRDVEGNEQDLLRFDPSEFVNIRFKVSDVSLEDEPRQFAREDSPIRSEYYKFQEYSGMPRFRKGTFNFIPGHNPSKGAGTASYAEQQRERSDLHNQIQLALYLQLVRAYGSNSAGTELSTPEGKRIDVVRKTEVGGYVFYEIKTSASALGCIRDALPQLLEYSYFPNENLADKLVIVSPAHITSDSANYLEHLRDKFRIPIYYQHYNSESNLVEDKLF